MVVALRLVSCLADKSLLSFSIHPELYSELLYYNHLCNLVFFFSCTNIIWNKDIVYAFIWIPNLEKYKKGDRKLI